MPLFLWVLSYKKLKVFVFFPFQYSYYKLLRVVKDFVINLEIITTFICLKILLSSVSSSVVVHTVGTSLYTVRSDVAFLLINPPNLNIFLPNITGRHYFCDGNKVFISHMVGLMNVQYTTILRYYFATGKRNICDVFYLVLHSRSASWNTLLNLLCQ